MPNRISSKLEEMVADLVSDERQKREEVEAILSQIHEMTEAYFDPERYVQDARQGLARQEAGELPPLDVMDRPEEAPAPVLSDAQRLQNFTKAFERRGMPPERAKDAAEEAIGMRDGRR